MRVLIATVGTWGDVQPLLALAAALRGRGHDVSFCAPPNFEVVALERGLRFRGIGADFRAVLGRREAGEWLPAASWRTEVHCQFDALRDLSGQADVIVGASAHCAGLSFAELRGIPYCYVTLSPSLIPSREHPAPLCAWQRLPARINEASWWFHLQTWNWLFRGLINKERSRMGLAPIRDVWAHLLSRLVILASEPALARPPADACPHVVQTGAWFPCDEGELGPDLAAFLEAGPPPVYIGFGSMVDSHPERTTRILLDAVHEARVRALISEGWAHLGAGGLPPEVRLIGYVPFSKLLPRLLAVVHHGGAGTVACAARAGVPQVLVPHFGDQYFWADRMSRLGLSAATIPRPHLSVPALVRALRACATGDLLRDRARALSLDFKVDGLDAAAKVIEAL